jgi:hypothetical protein
MKTNWNLKSAFFAATFSFAIAFGVTTGQAVFYPDTAQAGVLGKIGGAAKRVGGGVKKAAVVVGKVAAKTPPVKAVIDAGRAARDAARRIPRIPSRI